MGPNKISNSTGYIKNITLDPPYGTLDLWQKDRLNHMLYHRDGNDFDFLGKDDRKETVLCTTIRNQSYEANYLECKEPVVGSFLNITLARRPQSRLKLCEVEVFQTKIGEYTLTSLLNGFLTNWQSEFEWIELTNHWLAVRLTDQRESGREKDLNQETPDFNWQTDWRLTDWLTDQPIDRSSDRLTNWLTDWLTAWLTYVKLKSNKAFMANLLDGWATGSMADGPTCRLTDWLTDWLTDGVAASD